MGGTKPYWYYQLKFSPAGRLYTRLKHPGLRAQADAARQYYGQVLQGRRGLVFDIGANVGDLSMVFLEMGYTVVACEPDPENIKVLKARFANQHKIVVLPYAVASQGGMSKIYLSAAHGRSLSTLSKKRVEELDGSVDPEGIISFDQEATVQTITLDELIRQFGRPAFIKIDVEGLEPAVLAGLNQAVPLLSFEANLPAFLEETIDCIDKLLTLDPKALFNCSMDDSSLVFPGFQPADHFKQWLLTQTATYLEIFCTMPSK